MDRNLKMMIVDDQPLNRTILAGIFKDEYQIIEAENGKKALEALYEYGGVDIILLDIVMPEMNGIEFLKIITQKEEFKTIPVIVNTQVGEDDMEVQALDLGVEDFIVKPYNPRIVTRRVRNIVQKSVLERKQMAQELNNAKRLVTETVDELHYRVQHDWLTGIYNRETFYRETENMLLQQQEDKFDLLKLDIDGFKVVNELFGSQTGDKILISVAKMLIDIAGEEGTCGRLDADHFVVCVKEDILQRVFYDLVRLLSGELAGKEIHYPIYLHAGIYEITDIRVPIDLMCDRAGMALHTIKGNYVKRYAYYDEELRENMLEEQELATQMEIALEERQFYINLQPIYDVNTNLPVSAEALVRWNHPKKGFISPSVFVPLFEKNGFITKLDMFVWEEVCRTLADFKARGVKTIPVSINVSRINFYNPDLCSILEKLIDKYGLTTADIKLEITESAYTDNSNQLLSAMEVLQDKGFLILMDDFGSGYSSLNMLKNVPVDILKIDMMFIRSLETSDRASSILAYVIRMAKALNMDIVAEGVETENQRKFLLDCGCDCIQGYYYSRPLSVKDFEDLMTSRDVVEGITRPNDTRKTILIVDDMEITRTSVKTTLENDYKIIEAENGVEALEILKQNSRIVSLVITDISMPQMDGFELLGHIREDMVLRHIPIVVLTAMSRMDDEIQALQKGAVDVIVKPFDPLTVRQRVKNLIRLFEAEGTQAEKNEVLFSKSRAAKM